MPITISKKGAVNVFTISGRLTLGDATVDLQKKFKASLDAEESLYIFDLTQVPIIDSTSLGELVACSKRARERKGDIKLVLAPKGKVWEVMTITFLHKSFDIFSTIEEALAGFAK
jgi:anti-anti-sigma factor